VLTSKILVSENTKIWCVFLHSIVNDYLPATTANASVIASGHYLGEQCDYS